MNLKARNGLIQLRPVNLAFCLFVLSSGSTLSLLPAKALDCESFQLEQQPGYVAFVKGNMLEAETHLDQLLTNCPDREDVSLQRGLVYLEQGKYTLAQDVYYSLLLETPDKDVQRLAFSFLLDSTFKQQSAASHPLDALLPMMQKDLRARGSRRPWIVMVLLKEYLRLAPFSPSKPPASLPPVLLPVILEQLEQGTFETQLAAMRLLDTAGSREALPVIRRILGQSDQRKELLKTAIQTLAGLKDYDSAPVIRKLLRNPELRYEAIQALGELDDRDSLSDLLAVLSDIDFGLEAGLVAETIARWQAKEGLPAILALTERFKDDKFHYERLAKALARLGGPTARALLLKHASDPALNEEVRYEALNALGLTLREDSSQLGIFLEALASPERLKRLASLNAMRESILPEAYLPLQRHWEHEEDSMLKVLLLEVLLKYPDTDAMAWLHKALDDPDDYLRDKAAFMLADFSHLPGVAALYAKALGDESQDVRRNALYALPENPLPGVSETILFCLQEDDENMRVAAAKVLVHYRSPDVEKAVKYAFYKDMLVSVRQAARDTLAQWGYSY